jgi:hypothetical protein
MKSKRSTIAIIILITSFSSIFAQVDTIINGINIYPKRNYSAIRTTSFPKIDGKLDDDCWKPGLWAGDFRQGSPIEGVPPTQLTKFKILYDYGNIYIAFKCYDSEPDKIRRIYNLRDKYAGDIVGIALDSYDDDKTAFEFNVTAAGQKIDTKLSGDRAFDISWNAIWDASSAVSDSGWTAELKIPLSQLRYIDKKEQKWGLMIWRRLDRKLEDSFWQIIPKNATSMVYLFGELNGIIDIKPSRQLEFSPYLSSKYIPGNVLTRLPNETFKPFNYGAGLDSKIGVSSNLILDLSINPDFGQVEADPSVLNLTSYETFFEEKRPFFLEGNDIFNFELAGSQLFYSRRIGQTPKYSPLLNNYERINSPLQTTILGATKLTGKTSDGLSVGVMEIVTGLETASISSADTLYRRTVNPYTNYFVGRIKKEFNKANTILGGMVTSSNKIIHENYLREQLYTNSYTGGLDFIHYMKNKTYYVESKVVLSNINGSKDAMLRLETENIHRFQRPDAEHLNLDTSLTRMSGTGGSLSFGKKSGSKLRFDINTSWMSPNLDLNDLGYIRLTDMINQGTSLSYVSIVPNGIFRNFVLGMDQNASWSFGKELIDSRTKLFFNSQFNNMWNINSYIRRSFSFYDPRVLRGGMALLTNPYWTFYMNTSTSTAKDLQFILSYQSDYNEDNLLIFNNISANLRWFPVEKTILTGSVSYSDMAQKQQYILNKKLIEMIYLFGDLRNKTFEFTLRASAFFTNELSVEYYASTFLSTGNYSNFKKVFEPHAKDYEQRFYTYPVSDIILNSSDNSYSSTDLNDEQLNFTNPDFNFGQFRSNLVLRWEYNPGSMLYLVWTHDQTNQLLTSQMSQFDNFSNLFGALSKNVFMLKFNYWFTL